MGVSGNVATSNCRGFFFHAVVVIVANVSYFQGYLFNWFIFLLLVYSAAGGSSTVAIDNKIEQAMDLVKSHLMFAVREEVEVLKERIAELEERIAMLESENAILRSAATQVVSDLFIEINDNIWMREKNVFYFILFFFLRRKR